MARGDPVELVRQNADGTYERVGNQIAGVISEITDPVTVDEVLNPVTVDSIANPVTIDDITNPITVDTVTAVTSVTNPVAVSGIANPVTVGSVTNPVTVANPSVQGTLTDRSGTIAAGGVAQTVMNTNASRRYLIIQNLSATDVMYINFGVSAVAGQPSLLLAANGGSIVMEGSFICTQSVSIICATISQPFSAKEG